MIIQSDAELGIYFNGRALVIYVEDPGFNFQHYKEQLQEVYE